MDFTFTHSNKIGQIFFFSTRKKTENFIKQALECKFSPSKQTLKNIKSFAESLECRKTKTIGAVSCILN